MKEPFSNYARLGIVHFMAFPGVMKGEGIVESIERLASDPSFEVIEISTIAEAATRQRVAAILSASGLTVAFGAQPIILSQRLNLNAEPQSERAKAVTALKQAIDEAHQLGAVGFAAMSGPDPGPGQRGKAVRALEESLLELCEHAAAKRSMRVVLESFDRVPFGKNCLIGPTAEAVEIARRVRRRYPAFGLMIDLSHLPLLEEKAADCLAAASEALVHVHVGNCVKRDPAHPAYGDNHPRFGCEGGEVGAPQLAEFLRELLRIGYLNTSERRTVSFEVKPLPGESSDVVIANARRTLAEAWRML